MLDDIEKMREKFLNNFFYSTLVNKLKMVMQNLLIQKKSNYTSILSKFYCGHPPTFSKCIIKVVLSPKVLGFSTHVAFTYKG